MHWSSWLSFSFLVVVARSASESGSFDFPGPFVTTSDYSSNLVLVVGDAKVVLWNMSNPNNKRVAVTLWQLNSTTAAFFGGPEYIIQNAAPDTLSAPWTVFTAKNLTQSPMFYMNLFFEGETGSICNSQYLNITAKSTTTSSTAFTTSATSTSSTSSSSSISSTVTSTSSSPAPTSALTASSTSTPAPPVVLSAALSTGAKAGIAIGIVGAALLGLVAGLIILGKRRKTEASFQVPPPSYYEPQKFTQLQPYEVDGHHPAPPTVYELSPEMRQ